MAAVLDDYTTAPIDERVRATLGLLKKLTLSHSEVKADDVRHVRRAGVSRDAVEQALHVAYVFNIIDRMADALDFQRMTPAEIASGTKALLSRGYR